MTASPGISAPDLVQSVDNAQAAAIAAVTALVVLAIERWMDRASTQRELRRRALEEWLSALAAWVDGHRNDTHDQAAKSLMQEYQQLTNRQILELRLKRRDRYVAWWMHEMALALNDKNHQQTREEHRDQVLQDAGEALLRWHHGELKRRDFEIPYALRLEARKRDRSLPDVAADLHLSDYVEPQRMTRRHEWHIAKLMGNPKTGTPLMTQLRAFVGQKNALGGLSLVALGLMWTKLRLRFLELGLSRKGLRLRLLNLRLSYKERRLAKLEKRAKALEGFAELQEELQQQGGSKPLH